MVKTALKITGLILGVIIVLVAGGILWLTSDAGEAWLVKQGVKQAEALGLVLDVGELETNLFSWIRLEDVLIRTAVEKDTFSLADFSALEVHYSLMPLLSQEVVIDSIGLREPSVELIRDSTGFLNIPSFGGGKDTTKQQEPQQPSPWSFKLQEAGVYSLDARYNDRAANMVAIVSGLKVEADRADDALQVQVGVDSLTYQAPYTNITIHSFDVGGAYGEEGFTADTLGGEIPGGDLSGSGSVEISQSRLSAEVSLNADLLEIGRAFREVIPATWRPMGGSINLYVNAQGPFDSLRVHAEADLREVALERLHLPNTLIAATYENQRVTLDSIHVRGIGGEVNAGGFLDLKEPRSFAMRLHGEGVRISELFNAIGIPGIGLEGRLRLSAQGSGDMANPSRIGAGLSAQLSKTTLYGTEWRNASINAHLDNGNFNLAAHLGGNQLTVVGEDLFDTLHADINLRAADLTPFARLAGLTPARGSLLANGTITGPFSALAMRLTTRTDSLILAGVSIDTVYANAYLRDGTVGLDSAVVGTRIIVDDSLASRIEMFTGLRGRFHVHARAAGRMDSIRAEALLAAGFLSYDTLSVDSLHLKFDADRQRLSLSHGFFQRGESYLGLSGSYELAGSNWEARLMQAEEDTSSFSWLYDSSKDSVPPEGALYAYGSLPSSSQDSDTTNQANAPSDAGIPAPADSLRVALHGKEIRISQLATFYPLIDPIKGSISLQGRLSGSMKHPHAQMRFHLRKPGYGGLSLDSLGFAIHLEPDSVWIDSGRIVIPGSMNRFSGGIGLVQDTSGFPMPSDNSLFRINLDTDSLALAKLRNELLQDSLELTGVFSYDVTAEGRLQAPTIRGTLKLQDGRFRLSPNQPAVDSVQVELAFKDTVFTIREARAHSFNTWFDLEGDVTTSRWRQFKSSFSMFMNDSLAVRVRGLAGADTVNLTARADSLHLRRLKPFLPGIEKLRGVLVANVDMVGNTSDPDISGNIRLTGLSVNSTAIPVSLDQGRIVAAFRGDTLAVDTLQARANGGLIAGRANVYLRPDSWPLAEGQIQVGKVHFEEDDVYKANIDTISLTLTTQGEDYVLGGEINLGEVRYIENIGLQTVLRMTQGRARVSEDPDTSALDRLRLNVRLVDSDQLWVDNNLAQLRASAEFEVNGSPSNITFNGRLRILEGYVNYLDREFEILTGTLDFNDPNKINPYVNLTAEAEVTEYRSMDTYNYTITLSVTGDMDETEVTLTSNPPLDRANIISLLTLGTTRQQRQGGGTRGTEELIGQRAGMLAGQQLAGLAGEQLGLSQLTIEGNLFADSRATSPRIFASKRISEDLEITYITRIGYLDEHGIRINYYLTDHFSVEGQAQQNGESGINLRYRIRFR